MPLSSQLSPRIEYISFIRSFIHSFIPRQLCQCHLTPTPLSAPLGALNGSWRRCGTLCCFQEALLNAVCPVALSSFSPRSSSFLCLPIYLLRCSVYSAATVKCSIMSDLFCNSKIPEVKMLPHRKYLSLQSTVIKAVLWMHFPSVCEDCVSKWKISFHLRARLFSCILKCHVDSFI